MPWVQDIMTSTLSQTDNKLVLTTGVTVAAGNHVMVIGTRSVASDTIATLTTTASGATTSIDEPGINAGSAAVLGCGSIYCPNGMTNTDTVTITWTAASAFNFFGGQLVEYSGLATASWKDQKASAFAFHTQAAGIDSTATATTSQADELIFGVLFVDTDTETITATGGLTGRTQWSHAGPHYVIRPADKVVSATGTYSATGTWIAGNQNEAGIVVTYNIAAAVSGTAIAGVGRRLQGLIYAQG